MDVLQLQGIWLPAASEPPPPDIEVGSFAIEPPRKRKFTNRRKEIEEAAKKAFVQEVEDVEPVPITLEQLFPQESFPIIDPRLLLPNPAEAQDEQDIRDMIAILRMMGLI